MSISIISLPLPLILLVHLHILEYPHANKPEYDQNVFNPRVRGLRDRTKLMEDICYFLVGKLEGGRDGAKTILPMYPCLQPSETVAFRTSLSKYFETLRHQSLYPSLKTSLGASGGKAKAKESITEAESLATAWWWRDVVVRKSLLEECSSEKFERLLLSVSTHVLLRGSSTIPPERMSAVFRSQPSIYTDLLATCQSTRHLWFRTASLLLRRQGDLKSLRDNLNSHAGGVMSRYHSLTTQKLVSLSESKFNDLANSSWSGEEGRKVLQALIEMAGLKLMTPCTQLSSDSIQMTSLSKNDRVTPPSPLPIAAAHHPSNLRKLRKPIFNTAKTKDAERTTQTQLILSDSLNAEKNMSSALNEALIKAKMVSKSLAQRMAVLPSVEDQPGPKLDLWTPTETRESFNLNTEPTAGLLSSFGLDICDPKGGIEDRIDDLRERVLPPYPPVPDVTALRLPATDSQPNVPSTSVSVQSVGLFGSPSRGGLLTSTPPASVKPPSAYLQSGKTSVRFSLARTRRPTLFQNVMNDEVDWIVHGTQDDSTEEPNSEMQTPKRKQPVNRIWTVGSAKPKSTAKKGTPRDSFPMAALLIEPAMSLPSLLSSSLLHGDEDGDLNAVTPTFARRDSAASWLGDDDGGDDGWDGDDPPSMTLRDILLHADTSQFDLLDAEGDEDSMLGDDVSFEWN